MPASAVESVILPARVPGYTPALLDELTAAGEVYWVGDGALGESDGWVRWYAAEAEPHPPGPEPAGYRSQELLAALAGGGAYFFDSLLPSGLLASPTGRSTWTPSGIWSGPAWSPATPSRRCATGSPAALTGRSAVPRPAPIGPVSPAAVSAGRSGPGWPLRPRPGAGPWCTGASPSASDRLAADLFTQLDRYGVITRGSVLTENAEGGFGTAYRALSALEESGQCRRGYFVEGLGAAQFALTGAVDRLRAHQRVPEQPQARGARRL